jgi:hypothetical protein
MRSLYGGHRILMLLERTNPPTDDSRHRKSQFSPRSRAFFEAHGLANAHTVRDYEGPPSSALADRSDEVIELSLRHADRPGRGPHDQLEVRLRRLPGCTTQTPQKAES